MSQSVTIPSGDTLLVIGTASELVIQGGFVLTNSGNITVALSSGFSPGIENYGTINNYAGGTIKVTGTGFFLGIENKGSINISIGSSLFIGVTEAEGLSNTANSVIDNYGTINVQTGTSSCTFPTICYTYVGITNAGEINSNGTINLYGQTSDGNAILNTGGVTIFDSGTLEVTGSATFQNNGGLGEFCGTTVYFASNILGNTPNISYCGIGTILQNLANSLSSSTLTNIQSSLSSVTSSLTNIQSSLSSVTSSLTNIQSTLSSEFTSLSSAISNIGVTGPTVGTTNDASVSSVSVTGLSSFNATSGWTQISAPSTSDRVVSGFAVSTSAEVTNATLYISITNSPGSASSTYAIPLGSLSPTPAASASGQLRFPFSIATGSTVYVQVVSNSNSPHGVNMLVQLQFLNLPINGLPSS